MEELSRGDLKLLLKESNPSLVLSPRSAHRCVHLALRSEIQNGGIWGPSFCLLTEKLAATELEYLLFIQTGRMREEKSDRCKKAWWELILGHRGYKKLKRRALTHPTFTLQLRLLQFSIFPVCDSVQIWSARPERLGYHCWPTVALLERRYYCKITAQFLHRGQTSNLWTAVCMLMTSLKPTMGVRTAAK